MNSLIFKKIFSVFTDEKTSLHAGNLAYSTIISLIPALIILLSTLNIITTYIPFLKTPAIKNLTTILNNLKISTTTNIIINLICINLLSTGIYTLLTTFQKIFKFSFKNYIRKKLYSLALSFIFVAQIVISIFLSFLISRTKELSFIFNFIMIFFNLLVFYKFTTLQRAKNLYTGSLISAIILTILLSFFYTFINNFTSMESYYGIATPIIGAFLLMYYSCFIIYLGAVISHETSKYSIIKK